MEWNGRISICFVVLVFIGPSDQLLWTTIKTKTTTTTGSPLA